MVQRVFCNQCQYYLPSEAVYAIHLFKGNRKFKLLVGTSVTAEHVRHYLSCKILLSFSKYLILKLLYIYTELIPKHSLSMDTELAHFDGKPLFLDEYPDDQVFAKSKNKKSNLRFI